VPDAGFSQSLDRYAYGFNNPISNADPTGHAPVVAAVVAFVVKAVVAFVALLANPIFLVGLACTVVGYITNNPFLMTIGSIMMGYAGGGWIGAAMAAITSPLSPLDPKLKQIISWAYTAYGIIKGIAAELEAQANAKAAEPQYHSELEGASGGGQDGAGKRLPMDEGLQSVERLYAENAGDVNVRVIKYKIDGYPVEHNQFVLYGNQSGEVIGLSASKQGAGVFINEGYTKPFIDAHTLSDLGSSHTLATLRGMVQASYNVSYPNGYGYLRTYDCHTITYNVARAAGVAIPEANRLAFLSSAGGTLSEGFFNHGRSSLGRLWNYTTRIPE
jgi:hypothetical protein